MHDGWSASLIHKKDREDRENLVCVRAYLNHLRRRRKPHQPYRITDMPRRTTTHYYCTVSCLYYFCSDYFILFYIFHSFLSYTQVSQIYPNVPTIYYL